MLSPEVLARVLARHQPPRAAPAAPPLSARELEVLDSVARGLRNKEIAVRLEIAERTVKAHLASVFNRLGVGSRAGAVSAGIGRGLIPGGRTTDEE